jgi:hypothetical protein
MDGGITGGWSMWRKFLFLFLAVPFVIFAHSEQKEPNETGMLYHLWRNVKEKNILALKKQTSSAFLAIDSSASRNRRQMLEFLSHMNINSYELSNIKFTQKNDLIVFTYISTMTFLVDPPSYSVTIPQMTLFHKVGKKWKWAAQASLDQPYDSQLLQ